MTNHCAGILFCWMVVEVDQDFYVHFIWARLLTPKLMFRN